MRFSFGDFVLDTDRFLLERSGEPLHVQPQVLEVLGYLVSHRERVVPKTELLDSIWGDRFVSESTLSSRIKAARRLVGDDGVGQKVIKTIHGRGYRWVAQGQATKAAPAGPRLADPGRLEQQIRFCSTRDGTRIAYATVGSGPPLVRAAHWVTHLDYEWDSPIWQHWMRDLSRNRTLVRYDERGCGLSDHDPHDISLETFVDDLEAVVDELALERFPLMGVSQGGPVAIEYAHRHPERVSRLVLLGAFARGRPRRARTAAERQEHEVQRELIQAGWGRDEPSFRLFFSSNFMPDAPEMWTSFAELNRRTTSAENALRIYDACAWLDVVEAARTLDVPTLILHGRGDQRIPFSQGLKLASLIRGSRLVPLPTNNHLMQPDEPAWTLFLHEVDEFLGPGDSAPDPRSVHDLSKEPDLD